MKLLYLYSELMGYQIPVLKQLVEEYHFSIDVVHWDKKKNTPYIPEKIDGVSYSKRSNLEDKPTLTRLKQNSYDVVYISGWMDKLYLDLAKHFKKKGSLTVAGVDSQWKGTTRQFLGIIYYNLFYKSIIDKLWISGPYQFEFVRKLGVSKTNIIFNCYTADPSIFKPGIEHKQLNRRLLFLGRLEKIKGIELLVKVWSEMEDKKGWHLDFIGNGSLDKDLQDLGNSKLLGFKNPSELAGLIKNYDFLILPSFREPYALVIHEAMCAGLPVIASDCCGAAPLFIINNHTGFSFETGNSAQLRDLLERVLTMEEEAILKMKKNAYKRSKIITPQITAASLVSALG